MLLMFRTASTAADVHNRTAELHEGVWEGLP